MNGNYGYVRGGGWLISHKLGGGFKYFYFSPLLGEDSHFYEHLFQMGGSTTN